MKVMKFTIFFVGLLTFIACTDQPSEKTNASKGDSIADATGRNDSSAGKTCYASFKNKDTAFISITQNDTAISGVLVYDFYEKDRNNGTITGVTKGDTIIADYLFGSEGTTSTRQVVFLRRGQQLIEGFGDVSEDNGKMIFTNRSALTFDTSVVFQLTDCSTMPTGR
jgi:hypothetical protein